MISVMVPVMCLEVQAIAIKLLFYRCIFSAYMTCFFQWSYLISKSGVTEGRSGS